MNVMAYCIDGNCMGKNYNTVYLIIFGIVRIHKAFTV